MVKKRQRDSRYDFLKRAITGLMLIIAFYIGFFYLPPIVSSLIMVGILGLILVFEWPRLFNINDVAFWFLMPIYPILPFILMVVLNQHPVYRMLILFTAILVFSFDFGSYAFGSLFGKHKLAPEISPRKSWEGAAGGYLFSYIALAIILWVRDIDMSLGIRVLFTMSVCTFSLCGDFFESLLKRRAGVKDSGNLLPGHGGFLDRLDGFLFVIALVYPFREFFSRIFGLK